MFSKPELKKSPLCYEIQPHDPPFERTKVTLKSTVYPIYPCISQPPFWSKKNMFFLFLGKNLQKKFFYLRIFFQARLWLQEKFFFNLSFRPMYKSRPIFGTDF